MQLDARGADFVVVDGGGGYDGARGVLRFGYRVVCVLFRAAGRAANCGVKDIQHGR